MSQTPSNNNKTVAVLAEIFGGWFGFLGIGHFIMGNSGLGIALLLGWWVAIAVMLGIALGTLGGGLLCVIPLWFLVPVVSGFSIR